MISRDEAYAILAEHTKNPNLIKHMLAVEAGMRAYARRFGEDEETWAALGLLHDFDYEAHPEPDPEAKTGHPFWGVNHLREKGYPEEFLRAILSHADYTGVPRETRMAKALYAVDELTGLIAAVALVRPSKKVADVKLKSIKKKWKDKSFAAGVDREAVKRGAEELGVDLDEHILFVLEAMQENAEALGL